MHVPLGHRSSYTLQSKHDYLSRNMRIISLLPLHNDYHITVTASKPVLNKCIIYLFLGKVVVMFEHIASVVGSSELPFSLVQARVETGTLDLPPSTAQTFLQRRYRVLRSKNITIRFPIPSAIHTKIKRIN